MKCDNCKINKMAEEQNGCCIWYMDNVVLGNKSVDDCSKYKPMKKDGKKNDTK